MHASDAHEDRKWKRIVLMHGVAGYGALWWIIELMRREHDLCVFKVDLDLYAADMRIDPAELRSMVETAIDVELFQSDSEKITAPALVRDIEEFETKKDKWKTSKRQQRDMSETCDGHDETLIGHDEDEEDKKRIEEKREKKKGGAGGKQKYTQVVEIPPDELQGLITQFPHINVRKEFESACDWDSDKGKRHKDALAFFRNWLRNDKFRSPASSAPRKSRLDRDLEALSGRMS